MVKAPIAGQVKTRLARDVGTVRATQFHRHTAAAVIARLACPGRWSTKLAVTPDEGRVPVRWLDHATRCGQGAGDLSARMQRIMDRATPGPVVIIGTDIPAINRDAIAAAFSALGRADAVFGPAGDGGYWLVGLKRTPRVLDVFANVRWSTAHALADTLANLKGRVVARVATLNDVDCGTDLDGDGSRHGRVVRGHFDNTDFQQR